MSSAIPDIISLVILAIVELMGLFFMLKYFKKLPNPLGFVAKRFQKWMYRSATEYIASFVEELKKNPDSPKMIAAMLKKPVEILLEDFTKGGPKGGLPNLVSTGNAIIDIGQVLLPMFGAKGKMAAQALPLLGYLKKDQKGNDTNVKPWG